MDEQQTRRNLEQAIFRYAMSAVEADATYAAGNDANKNYVEVLNNWTTVSKLIDRLIFDCQPKTSMVPESSKTTQEVTRAIGLPNPQALSGNLSSAYIESPCETSLLYKTIDRVQETRTALPKFESMQMLDFECPANLNPHSKMLVAGFASVMAMKMRLAEGKYGYEDSWKNDNWKESCMQDFEIHLQKGDMRDVAIYAAFMWYHGWKL